MSENKLKTAILGLNSSGLLLLEAAAAIDYFQVQAVADKDTKLAEKTALRYNCAHYDDYRRLIIQNHFDCLLVAAGMYSCDDYIRMAMKKKFNLLKVAPAAGNFEQAVEFVRLAEEKDIKFVVANPDRFAESFLALRKFLGHPKDNEGYPVGGEQGLEEQILMITAVCTMGNRRHPTWQTDPKLAGGGVLLHNCYPMLDQIVWNFATPQQVYSLNTNSSRDRQQRLYLTEDIAVVTMKFTDTFIGNLIASRAFGPEQEVLKVYSRDKILTVSNSQLIISDRLGQPEEQLEYSDNELLRMKRLLENFALSLLWPDKNTLCSSGRENLQNMAVIESAYLSARTGMPEEPAKILQMAQIEPITIWPAET